LPISLFQASAPIAIVALSVVGFPNGVLPSPWFAGGLTVCGVGGGGILRRFVQSVVFSSCLSGSWPGGAAC
jgi:hypothetical protein